MKKKAGIALVAIVAGVFAFLSSSCAIILFSVSGTVLNVKASSSSKDSTLDGATITFTGTTDSNVAATYTATVSGDSYSVLNVEPGKYTITGSKSGFMFIPQDMVVSGILVSAPDLLAFPAPSQSSLAIVLKWENKDYDLDLHAKFGAENVSNSVSHVYYDNLSSDSTSGGGNPILPDGTTTDYVLTLDRDVKFEGSTLNSTPVETLSITLESGATNISDDVRIYVDQYSKGSNSGFTGGLTGNTSASKAPANATVYAILYDAGTNTSSIYGVWKLPTETEETTLQIMDVTLATSGGNMTFTPVTNMVNPGNHVFKGIDGVIGVPSAIR